MEASIVAKGVAKNHLDAAAKELQESIELANLGHIGSATLHAEAAVNHIKVSDKYIDSAVIIQNLNLKGYPRVKFVFCIINEHLK